MNWSNIQSHYRAVHGQEESKGTHRHRAHKNWGPSPNYIGVSNTISPSGRLSVGRLVIQSSVRYQLARVCWSCVLDPLLDLLFKYIYIQLFLTLVFLGDFVTDLAILLSRICVSHVPMRNFNCVFNVAIFSLFSLFFYFILQDFQ